MIRVLVADNDVLIRLGIKSICQSTRDIAVLAEADTGYEVLQIVEYQPMDVVLLDISLRGQTAIDTLLMLRKGHPNLPVLILGSFPESLYAVRVMKQGGAGYLTKKCQINDLIAAIRTCAAGQKYITSSLTEALLKNCSLPPSLHHRLTNREFELLVYTAQGWSANQIGDRLCLSPKTIRRDRQHMLRKLSAKNEAEVVRYLARNGFFEGDLLATLPLCC